MKLHFTKAAIDALVATAGKRLCVYDAKVRGLQIVVQPSGHKRFYLYRKIGTRPERIALGLYPDMPIDAARRKAEQLNASIADGRNPARERAESLREKSFGELFNIYMERHAKPRKRSWKSDECMYNLHLSRLASRRLDELKRRDFADIHGEISKTRPAVANRVLCLASSIFGRAIEWGLFEKANPCKGIRANREVPRSRFLRGNELRRFLQAVDEEPCDTSRDYILIALLTGARRGNIIQMEWIELDLIEAEWRIPAAKFKSGEEKLLPLAPEAVAILQRRYATRSGPWVFPSVRSNSSHGYYNGTNSGWKRVLDRAEANGLAEIVAERAGEDVAEAKRRVWEHVAASRDKRAMKRSLKSATQETLEFMREQVRQLGVDPDLARLRDLRGHDLRRTLASWQVKTGASLYVAGKSLGHNDLKTTTIYAQVDVDAIRSAVDRAGKAMLAVRDSPRSPVRLPGSRGR